MRRTICRAMMTSIRRAYFSSLYLDRSLLVAICGPNDCSVGSQGEKKSDYVREEEHNGSKPAIRPDSVNEEAII